MEETRNAPYSNGEDRISRLPDTLIHRILSFIDAKYAVQASVLSKRWIDIWKSLPVLNFSRRSFAIDKTHSFTMFVDMVFLFRGEFDIRRFVLHWKNSAYDHSVKMNVIRWSLNAVKYNVQDIVILITESHNSAYEIPHRLLNCKSLRKLEVQVIGGTGHADIILPRSVSLPQLKVLCLIGLSISSVGLSKRLFSCCPVLETLRIDHSNIQTDTNRKLIIDSLSLKKLDYADYWQRHPLPQNDTMSNVIKLCTPSLELFNFGSLLTHDYSLENCSTLV